MFNGIEQQRVEREHRNEIFFGNLGHQPISSL